MSQTAIAEACGVSQCNVGNVLWRERKPSLWLLDQLAEAAGVEVDVRVSGPVPVPG